MAGKRAPSSLVGGDILNLVTTGAYDNPLAVYREYIQNAADAVGSSQGGSCGRIEIEVDSPGMRARIRDYGPGLTGEEAVRALLPIARSRKKRGEDRGFRGIGRLSGLAFAETVIFLTRARGCDAVCRVVWDGSKLRESIRGARSIERAIRESVVVEKVPGMGYPNHFFEVEIVGVGRHAAGLMLNGKTVRAYIAEVAPVPFSKVFPFAAEVDDLLRGAVAPLALDIVVDGDARPVTRLDVDSINFSTARRDDFSEFQKIEIPSLDNDERAAVGWVVHSSYLGTIPKEVGIRGIRAREGNMQIGGDTVFESLFSEERFNRWCVGEIHILDPRIVPNSRRDYFEPGPHTRNLENCLAAVLHGIAARCRKVSSMRNSGRRIAMAMRKIEETYELAASGYLTVADAEAMIERASSKIPEIRRDLDDAGEYAEFGVQELRNLQTKLGNFKAKKEHLPFGSMSKPEIEACRKIFHALARATDSPRIAKETIEAVLVHA